MAPSTATSNTANQPFPQAKLQQGTEDYAPWRTIQQTLTLIHQPLTLQNSCMGYLWQETPWKDVTASKAHGIHRSQGEQDLRPLGRRTYLSFLRCTLHQSTLGQLYQPAEARNNCCYHINARHTTDWTHIISASNKPAGSRQMAYFYGEGA